MHIGVFKLNHGFFSLLGANMASSWDLKSMKNWKKEVQEGVEKAHTFQKHFYPLLALSWGPSWLQVGAQDDPRRRPRAPKSRPKRPPRRSWQPSESHSAPKTRRTPQNDPQDTQNDPIFKDFRNQFSPISQRFWSQNLPKYKRIDTDFLTLRSPPLFMLGLD